MAPPGGATSKRLDSFWRLVYYWWRRLEVSCLLLPAVHVRSNRHESRAEIQEYSHFFFHDILSHWYQSLLISITFLIMSRRSESATGPIRTLPLKVQLNAAQQQRRRRRIGWPLETAEIQRHTERERDGLADEWSVGKFEQAQCDAVAVFLSEFQQAPIHLPFPVRARQLSCTLFSLLRAKIALFIRKFHRNHHQCPSGSGRHFVQRGIRSPLRRAFSPCSPSSLAHTHPQEV